MDRITELLEAHIRLAERQLELMRTGMEFSILEDEAGTNALPSTEASLMVHLANLQNALARHKARNQNA